MAYTGINKTAVDKLKNKLSHVKVKSGFVGEKYLKDIVDEALTGSGNEHILDDAWNGSRDLKDRQLLAEIYLLSRDRYYNYLKDSMEVWKSVFVDLGFTDFDNPFMKFLDNFKYRDPLDKECCRQLCNAYSDGTVSRADLEDTSKFVYNPYLYEHGVETSAYLSLYKKLLNESLINTIVTNIKTDTGRTDITPDKARNFILFGNFEANENNSPLVPMRKIKEALDKYARGAADSDRERVERDDDESDEEEDDVTRLITDIDRLSDADRRALFDALKTKFGLGS